MAGVVFLWVSSSARIAQDLLACFLLTATNDIARFPIVSSAEMEQKKYKTFPLQTLNFSSSPTFDSKLQHLHGARTGIHCFSGFSLVELFATITSSLHISKASKPLCETSEQSNRSRWERRRILAEDFVIFLRWQLFLWWKHSSRILSH